MYSYYCYVFWFTTFFDFIGTALDFNEENISLADGFTIEEWLEYEGRDGKVIKRKSNVLDYRADGEDYTVDRVNKKARIKIGNATQYVGTGKKTYVIKYTYDMSLRVLMNLFFTLMVIIGEQR